MAGIIFGNVCSFLATVTDSISSTRRTTKGMLGMQCLSQLIFVVVSIAFQGYADLVQNVVGLVRNLFAMREKQVKGMEWVFVALAVGIGLYFNNLGWLGLLPVLANFEYSLAVFRFADNERAMKVAFAVMNVLYMIYNFCMLNVVGGICSAVVIVTTVIYLVKNRKSAA
ncbi:MAG: YgjV family protein [Oscillospiraceae bacterium]|nr:YgjV family protein [Oscillospiraceae bacterium]